MINSSFYIEVFVAAGIYLATFIYLLMNFLRNMPLKDWLLRFCIAPALILHILIIANNEFLHSNFWLKTVNILSLLSLLLLFVHSTKKFRKIQDLFTKSAYLILPVSSFGLFTLGFEFSKNLKINMNFSLTIYFVVLILASSLLILALLQSFILNWQYKILKDKKPTGALDYFPPLQTNEILMFDLLTISWVILTFILLNSFSIFINSILGNYFAFVFSTIFVLWIYFGIILLFKYTGRLSTLVGVRLISIGSFVVFGIYFGIYLFLAYLW